jgi:hypothetical protein
MRILFDHGTPAPLADFLAAHAVSKAKDLGWDKLLNGDLLRVAEEAGFEVFVTTDKNLHHQQNLSERRLAIVVLGISAWPILRRYVDHVVAAISKATPGSYSEVEIPANASTE